MIEQTVACSLCKFPIPVKHIKTENAEVLCARCITLSHYERTVLRCLRDIESFLAKQTGERR